MNATLSSSPPPLAAINSRGYASINEVLVDACRRYGPRAAFTSLGRTLTYTELERQSAAFASYLLNEAGLEPGDRIAVQLPNLIQYPVVAFGALRAGLVVVNTNPLYTPRELAHQFKDSGARALVVLANMAHQAASIIKETEIEQVVVTEVADLHAPLKRTLLNGAVRYLKRQVPRYHFPRSITLRQALRLGAGRDWEPAKPDAQTLAVLQYTGGTTGVAKGAMLTHGNLVANYLQLHEHLKGSFTEGHEVFVGPLPLYHIYAFTLHCLLLVATGNHSVLIPNPRDLKGLVKELKRRPFTGFAGLNTLFVALCRDPGFQKLDFSRLHLTASGGMALTRAAAEQWQQVTGCPVVEGYGLTETSPGVSFNQPHNIRLGTVGQALPSTEVKVVSPEGEEQPAGIAGELWVRGPQVMKGYWKRAEETATVLNEEGWLRTGDMACLDDQGFIQIVDRQKDLIIVSGFNVYPNEVEAVAISHPGLRECAAVGIPDPGTGEAVRLFVVADDPDLTEQAVRDHCRAHMAAYKVPRSVVFCDELPKSNVGKVLRRALKQQPVESAEAGA
ncbi:AMP-binding protein [Motiliproteus sp. SC1-56]|uniref:AMP-binding protein n=1 Tax=Motiliproteus sp. SC1-56 TaxID=2799565 RepID=UPI001A8CD096|nr:AMP-binding protein [Motiliproteus sp. SC1-56]